MRTTTVYAFSAVVVAILVVVLALSFGFSGSEGEGSTSSATSSVTQTTSVQGENRTVIATYVTSLSSSTDSSTTATTTSTASSTTSVTTAQPPSGVGSFTYTPSSQVKVLSVAANVFPGGGAESEVQFSVKFQNIGASPIYVLNGGGSGLNVTVTSGDSVVESYTGIRCELVEVLGPLGTGANATVTNPGCWSGYSFQLVRSGMVVVKMTLGWANGTNGGPSGEIEIDAEFNLG